MRTTLTLDPDVVAALRRRQAERGTRLKEEVNALLRAGLAADQPDPPDREVKTIPTVSVGSVRIRDPRAWKDMLDDEDDARTKPAA